MNIIERVHEVYIWLKKQEISFLVYISIFILLFIGGLVITNKSSQLNAVFTSLLIFLVLFGLVWDSINILVKYKSTNWGVLLIFIVSVLFYFINIQSESIANTLIASTTGEKAQYFPVVASYFEVIFTPLAFLIILIKNFGYITPALAIILVLLISGVVIKNKWRKIFLHLLFYISAMFSLIMIFGSDNEKIYEDFFGLYYIPKKIVEYAYHKNTSCEGIGEPYINFLYKDKISVTNIKEIKYSNNDIELVFMSKDDQNITFSTQQCVKKEIVSSVNTK